MAARPLKVLIAGGGTGGHFFSGVAVGEAIVSRNEGNRVVYVGTRTGIEARVGPRMGLDVRFVTVAGIKGKGLFSKLAALVKLPVGVLQGAWLVLKERPDFVLGVGGYASFPVVLAARLLGRKTGVVEQNSVAGLTNRMLGRLVHRVFVAFEETIAEFAPHKVHFTGNPLRADVVRLLALESTGTVGIGERMKVLVLGGSQGARALNEAFMGLGEHLDERLKHKLLITHQAGVDDEERVRAAYAAAGIEAHVHAFIDDIAQCYRAADLVVCRAGALTVSEVGMSARPAIFVPYPFAIYNHQERNARALVDAGAAELILQSDLTPESLAAALGRLEGDRRSLQRMAVSAGHLARPQAASEVVEEMCALRGGR